MTYDEQPRALGLVPVDDPLAFALIDGESLVACASWALGEADVELFDFNVPWDQVRDAGRPLVLHDPLCPLTPADFIGEAVQVCLESGRPVVGVRPVTDTIKTVVDGMVTGTLDRSELVQVVSPIVLPATSLGAEPPSGSFADLVAGLADVIRVEAPALARRIADQDDLRLLEAQLSVSASTTSPA